MIVKKTTNKRELIDQLELVLMDVPKPLIKNSVDIIVDNLVKAISEDRDISLRGFGRFILKRYASESSKKKLGFIFKPSPELVKKIN